MSNKAFGIILCLAIVSLSIWGRGALLPAHSGEAIAASPARGLLLSSALLAKTKKDLLKSNASDVLAMLDTPEMIRRELKTVSWQYRTDGCVLDLYFSAKGTSDKALANMPVIHFETRTRTGGEVAQGSCLGDVIAAYASPNSTQMASR